MIDISSADGTLQNRADSISRRRDKRLTKTIRALCYVHGRFETVELFNISAGGTAIRMRTSLVQGDRVQLVLLNNRKLDASVRWWLAGACGIQFETRLADDDYLLRDAPN
jgi:hypothetical protein